MNMNDPEMIARLEHAGLVAELTRPLVHEVNNFLNTLLLQISMMEATVPGGALDEWNVIRRDGRQLAGLIQNWQRLRGAPLSESESRDLNQLVRDCVASSLLDLGSARQVELVLARESLWVQGALLDWRSLCLLLSQCAFASRERQGLSQGAILIQTRRDDREVILEVSERGPELPVNVLESLFDAGRNMQSGLELSACKNLAHRLHGSLNATNHPLLGLTFTFATMHADV